MFIKQRISVYVIYMYTKIIFIFRENWNRKYQNKALIYFDEVEV